MCRVRDVGRTAHGSLRGLSGQADVNVASWNAVAPHTLASGGDDGRLRVWDLRAFSTPVADFKHHRCRQTPPPPSPIPPSVWLAFLLASPRPLGGSAVC